MEEIVKVNYLGSHGTVDETLDIPSKCPHCGETMSPKFFNGNSRDKIGQIPRIVGVLAKCSFDNCGRYYGIEFRRNATGWEFLPASYKPIIKVELPENIEKVSSSFVEIYSQATIAESEKLDQIAGVGYRKAAEFLIKDYAIRKHPDEESSIKKKQLVAVIKNYLKEFPRLQQLSTAIAWIGNDETHYVRRHDHKDINDLKRFIKASAQFIAADYDVDEAFEFTSDS